FHHDQVTSTTAVTGHNGGTTQSVNYAAFGAVQSSTGSSPNRLKYTGREDDGNGLLYYRARYYDPAIGRFISEDPMGFASGDMSFYVYAANSPIDNNDPTGHNPVTRFIRESAEYLGVKASAAAMQAAKNRAVDMAWKAESQLIKNNLPGTRSWGPDELKFLQQGKSVPGYAGHHINSASGYPTLAGNPDNIQFLRAGEHSALHSANGGTQVPTYGPLLDRTAGGSLPRVADSSGFSLKSAIIGGAASVLSGVSQAAEFLDAIDPSSVIFNIPSTGGCNAGRCSDMVDWSKFGSQSFYSTSAPANGGFLLYPNKPNNNMMQSVYSK
ncbi:MAG: RHS repeat-associated core domain-containing protein, partial [Pseudomonadota bacterium]